ncbi:LCP family protein [Lachnoclostridium phytofermentans]|uniref:Cell envelope-related transcriptional attenuator n=1 Tax=Lachnoclostridium phytofermentans (strain ATCC 700394 / DSM 18823 / ISDg) TaxID=357809 RepID=A9KNY4_LACP7|nr:LCP family protein [Lachnoclostridium phytofermentans]ABX43154.1 cell envelope-related transcriptional attenuator [Lachnoclostridium phytofermentans ISDg]
MKRKTDIPWEEFDPSSDEEFQRNLEKAFFEDEPEEQIAIEFASSDESEYDNFELYEKAVHSIVNQELMDAEEEVKQSDKLNCEEEEIISEITRSLAKQIDPELAVEETMESPLEEEKSKEALRRKRLKQIGLPILITLGALLLSVCLLFFTKAGQSLLIRLGANFVASKVKYDDGSGHKVETIPEITDVPTNDDIEKNEEDVQLSANNGTVRHEDYAVNILLLGEEAIFSGNSRGRTDVMMIATLNSKEKSIKLTSLMRDLYVQIPGYQDDKLNAAYAVGGIPMLFNTIELNFDLKLDGYCLVGFDDFEKIIDKLNGIDITLTSAEANWLNTTNYISNPNNRTVTAGLNHMNGNQALGFCRIRDVASGTNENNDFGRTSRHRTVLDAIFEKYKSLNYWDLAMLMNSCLPMVTTDLDAKDLETYIQLAKEIGLTKLDQLRIPVNSAYEDAYISKKSVIIPNLQKNIEVLHTFIFGSE